MHGQGGKLDNAVTMFTEAQNSGFLVDEKTYTNMIGYYGKAGEYPLLWNNKGRSNFCKSKFVLLFVISDFWTFNCLQFVFMQIT